MSSEQVTSITVGRNMWSATGNQMAELGNAHQTLRQITFAEGFFGYWYPETTYVENKEYPEVTDVVLEIRPAIFKDYTRWQHDFEGTYESIHNPFSGLANWLWHNPCPKLQNIHVEWTESSLVEYKYYDGDRDFDRREKYYYRTTDRDCEDEKLDGNLLIETFMPDILITWGDFNYENIKFYVPAALMERMELPASCTVSLNPKDTGVTASKEAFDAILEKYKESRNNA